MNNRPVHDVSFDIVMCATHIDNKHINTLCSSIIQNNKSLQVLLVILSQACEPPQVEDTVYTQTMLISSRQVSSSAARNICTDFVRDNKIKAEFIIFPDDDTSFDASFFSDFLSVASPGKNYLTPIYNTGTFVPYLNINHADGAVVPVTKHTLVGCPNQVISFHQLPNLFFDEKLGVGARYGSCEDYDLFIRLSEGGVPYQYTSRLYSFHPAKTTRYEDMGITDILKRFKSYSSGFAFTLFKYRMFGLIPSFLYRTAAASLYFLFKLKFKLAYVYFYQLFIRIGLLFFFSNNRPKA